MRSQCPTRVRARNTDLCNVLAGPELEKVAVHVLPCHSRLGLGKAPGARWVRGGLRRGHARLPPVPVHRGRFPRHGWQTPAMYWQGR